MVLASLLLSVVGLAPQGSQADAPVGLAIVVVAVGQGDGIVIRAPDGTVHVVDAGPEGQGLATMVPAIDALAPQAYGYTVLSHFHADHSGGLDDVLNTKPFATAFDRGDVNRPATASVNSYLNAAGARRQTITVGAAYALGGGATMRCIAANGDILGGTTIDPTPSSQQENSRSVVLRLEFGDFSMWLGGDLTGGGSGTGTVDVESAAALACGDVDVYKLNHHGSTTSTNQNLIDRLQPELAVASCGFQNSFGHPNAAVINRLNQAAAARSLLSTTSGSASTLGFSVAGTVRIDTDGYRYRATAQNGDFLDFFCDEVVPAPIAAGELRISEIHRDPAVVPDTAGEYIEVVNVGSKPVALRGLRLLEGGGSMLLASNFMAVPGRPLLFQVDGAPARNGDQPLGVAMPAGALALGDSADSVLLMVGPAVIDNCSYTAGFPGGSGVAAERIDLLAPSQSGANWNFAAATLSFGSGDLGSPGRANATDATSHSVQIGVSTRPDRFTLHATALDHGNFFSVLLLAYGTTPATPFGGAVIPLAFDPLFQASLGGAGFIALMPSGGYRSIDVPVPQPNPLAGTPLYAAHVVLDYFLQVPGVSPAVTFLLP